MLGVWECVLGFKPRASCMQGKCSTPGLRVPAPLPPFDAGFLVPEPRDAGILDRLCLCTTTLYRYEDLQYVRVFSPLPL